MIVVYLGCEFVLWSPLERRVRLSSRVKVINVVAMIRIILDPSVYVKCLKSLVQGTLIMIVCC